MNVFITSLGDLLTLSDGEFGENPTIGAGWSSSPGTIFQVNPGNRMIDFTDANLVSPTLNSHLLIAGNAGSSFEEASACLPNQPVADTSE